MRRCPLRLFNSGLGVGALLAISCASANAGTFAFSPGDVIVSVEGDGSNTGNYTDHQAAPVTLFQYSINGNVATSAGTFAIPSSNFSGEYGSSSEGTLTLSGDGRYLTLMGYGVNATSFNNSPGSYGGFAGNTALAQSSSSLAPRVVALIGANGSVDTSTALTNVFNQNNPRSAYTANGTSFYVSGQGNSPDATGGVFYAPLGATTATAISGLDTSSKSSSQDTRTLGIYNNTLYVSVDSKAGSGSNRAFIGTLGAIGTPPTSLANGQNGPTQLSGFGSTSAGQETITALNGNTVNGVSGTINLSPENFFFANASTLYVADSGSPKNTSGGNKYGDGGLQKWVNSSSNGTGTWSLEYTLSQGLNLVGNSTATSDTGGTTGLYGLTGKVVGGNVVLYATNYTIGDTDSTYLYGISDSLSAVSGAGESFTQLEAAPADENFKGVAFAPQVAAVPLPAAAWFLLSGLGGAACFTRRRKIAA